MDGSEFVACYEFNPANTGAQTTKTTGVEQAKRLTQNWEVIDNPGE